MHCVDGVGRSVSADLQLIYVRPGGNGEIEISTPGDGYAAYDGGAGVYWVGTQREFDRERVFGISKESGRRLSLVNSDGVDATFVSEGTLRAHVGVTVVDGLAPTVLFGANIVDTGNSRCPMRLVDVQWIQSGRNHAAPLYFQSA